MKNIVLFSACLTAFFLISTQGSAQNSAYWEKVAQQALAKTDRTINHYNNQLKVFSPQEMQMMRNNDPRFTQIANRKTQRLDAAQRQYETHYNKRWSQSFNTFNSSPRYVRDRYGRLVRVN